MVYFDGGDVSVRDGLRPPARQSEHRKLQFPVCGKRAGRNGGHVAECSCAGGIARIASHALGGGSEQFHRRDNSGTARVAEWLPNSSGSNSSRRFGSNAAMVGGTPCRSF